MCVPSEVSVDFSCGQFAENPGVRLEDNFAGESVYQRLLPWAYIRKEFVAYPDNRWNIHAVGKYRGMGYRGAMSGHERGDVPAF